MSTYTLAVALPPASPSLPSEVGDVGATRAAPRRRMRAFNEDGAADDGATVVDGGRATADAAGRWMTNRTTIIKARSWFITSFSLIIFPFGFLLWEKREKILRVVGPRSTLNKGIINSGKTHFKITRNLE